MRWSAVPGRTDPTPVRPAGRAGTHPFWSALRWLGASVALGVLTAFACLLVTGRYADEGPVLLVLRPGRGVHRGDLFVIAGWALGVCAVLTAVASAGRRER
ncbi:hypothetical protein [Modestobacter italicus]|uniref:hypothetical protein n=1 Tax=Modestobacter italicus (strain DSM 44449 / CECT 9708 / BC 501) TaxID=2732864 RepID=UPI001C957A31|nr:hypothetical protein [Modestobacter italicus]